MSKELCTICDKPFKFYQEPLEAVFSGNLFHKKCYEKEERKSKKTIKK